MRPCVMRISGSLTSPRIDESAFFPHHKSKLGALAGQYEAWNADLNLLPDAIVSRT